MHRPFYSSYSHGFIRVAVAIPSVRVADCNYNVERTLHLARRASENHAAIVLFPELGISAYSNEDLFHQDALLDDARSALALIKTQSRGILSIIVVGAPLRFEGKLFNCAVVIYKGKVLGITANEIDIKPSCMQMFRDIGPYEIQDFNLYHLLRFGYRPSKVAFLAYHAWRDKARGIWPDFLPEENRNEYDLVNIKKWLKVFLYRFFKTNQFKRSAMPNAPKVGSGGSLSPRSDWRAPCDSEATAWLKELEANVPD